MPSNIKTTLTLPEDLHWKFKEEVARRRIAADKDAVIQAVELWLAIGALAPDLAAMMAEPENPNTEIVTKAITRWKNEKGKHPVPPQTTQVQADDPRKEAARTRAVNERRRSSA